MKKVMLAIVALAFVGFFASCNEAENRDQEAKLYENVKKVEQNGIDNDEYTPPPNG